MDADVIKTYVELGLGVGIVAAIAFDDERDTHLRAIDARHLFAANMTRLAVRRGAYLRDFVYDFIAGFAPPLTKALVAARAAPAAGHRPRAVRRLRVRSSRPGSVLTAVRAAAARRSASRGAAAGGRARRARAAGGRAAAVQRARGSSTSTIAAVVALELQARVRADASAPATASR